MDPQAEVNKISNTYFNTYPKLSKRLINIEGKILGGKHRSRRQQNIKYIYLHIPK
jgi:hypothetical protein